MTQVQKAIPALRDYLKGKIASPNDPNYDSAQTSYFSAQARSLSPVYIISPTTSAEVALIVKTLAKYKVKFAIRGGGHTLNAGAANIEGGVTINLRGMNDVSVNAEKTIVSIGGGAKWGEVYPVLDALGIATSGGRVADVGVGGLTTGGGISFFSAREGLVCDNVSNYEVVLANGDIVSANPSSNPDLFLALKGGSNNFGIVTRFDIRTFPQENFFGGCIVHDYSTLDIQLSGFANLLENFDPYAAIMISISWNQKRNGFSIFNNLEYTKNETSPEVLRPFLEAKPQFMNTMRVSNLSDFAKEAGKFAAPGLRNQFATTTFGGGLEMLQTVHGIWKSSIPSISSITGINWAMTIQPLPTKPQSVNSLGLSPSSSQQTLFLLSYNWESISDDDAVTAAAQKLIWDIDTTAKERGVESGFKYLNYCAGWQNPIGGYGEERLKVLREVGDKFDPEGVFQGLCEGGFKVSKA